MKRKGIVALTILAAIPFFVSAYVSPGKPTGFVNDFAGILSPAEKSSLETTLSDFEKRTGNEIVIAIVPTLGDESPVTYGVRLFEEWGIGKEDKDNGLLILHALQERQIRLEVGYGLEPYITDAKASAVYRNILAPAFKEGKYGEGYTVAVAAIIDTIGGEVNAIPDDSESSVKIHWENFIYFIFFGVPMYLGIMASTKSWWFGGASGFLVGFILSVVTGIFSVAILAIPTILGLILDYMLSKKYAGKKPGDGPHPPWWIGGGHMGGGRGGGFGGFGGGRSGGGGGGGGY